MLAAILRLSLRYRGLVLVAALVALVYGAYLTSIMPIDVFPDLDRPRVVLLSECPGLSPEEVETLVALPVETAILGAAGVQAVRSQSSSGLVVTYVEFDWQTEIRAARQIVQERLTTIQGMLPPGVRPFMTPSSSIMGQIMHVGMYRRRGPHGGELAPVGATGLLAEWREKDGEPTLDVWRPRDRRAPDTWESIAVSDVQWGKEKARHTVTFTHGQSKHTVSFSTALQQRMDLRSLADWVIRPRLLRERGIAEVILMGGDRKQYQVLVDPARLLQLGVSLAEVERALRDNNLNASGGYTEEGQIERPIRILGRLGPQPEKVLDDLRKVVVKANPSRSVLLGQVASVVEGPAPKRGDGGIDGHDGVIFTIVKQPHADTRAVTDRVRAALREVQQSLPADVVINAELFQLKSFIDRGIYYVGEALVLGALLVVVVLFLFLFNLRTTFITLTAIPLSLVITTLVFQIIGMLSGTELSINVMTLGGIAVAMGELVDDAIVDVENIFRRLGENSTLTVPKPALLVVYEASQEIRSAIVFGTAVVVLAFLPLFALSGVEGRLFVPLGIAYIVSILASLLVSLTVTPVLSYYLLRTQKSRQTHGDNWLVRQLKWGASFLIRFSMRHATALLVLTWLLVILSLWKVSQLGTDFLPRFDEGSIQINVTLPSGASLQASNEAAALIDARLRAQQKSPDNPEGPILHFARRTGRAELDEHVQPVNVGEYILTMQPEGAYHRDEFLRAILADLRREVPGVDFEAEQPLAHLISHMLSGVTSQIAIKVYGDDLDKLQQIATQIKGAISDIPGLTPPMIDPQEVVDELHVILRADDLAFYGLSRAYLAEFVQTALKGEVVSQVVEEQRRFDLVVKLREPERTDYLKLRDLRIDLPSGRGQIRLGDVADLPEGSGGPNQINRDNVRRRAVIRCNVSGRDLGSVVAELERRVQDRVTLPPGYFVEYGGQFESQRSATLLIGVMALVSLAGIYTVLYLLYPSTRITLQILNAIPTAFIGGVFALVLTNQTLTVATLVGFVSLGGIAVRNGILLVTHYFHLMRHEGESFSEAMVLRGSLERLSPVLMTALTAGIALAPIVASGQKPGLEILYPVATVILGGLITSTFCEFLLHPGLFWKFSGKDAQTLTDKEQSVESLLTDVRG